MFFCLPEYSAALTQETASELITTQMGSISAVCTMLDTLAEYKPIMHFRIFVYI